QHSCFLYDEIAVLEEDYSGFTLNRERIEPIARLLGKNRAVLMPNHGSITWGENIKQAVIRMKLLDDAVKYHLGAVAAGAAAGIKPKPIGHEDALRTKEEMNQLAINFNGWQLFWDEYMAELQETDPYLQQVTSSEK